MLTRRLLLLTGAGASLLPSADSAAQTPCAQAFTGQARVSLNGLWRFRLDPQANGDAAGWPLSETPSAGWREVSVPHTWQVEQDNAGYRGLAWYRRSFEAPAAWSGRAVRLEFEAVFHTATVWVNGKAAGRHIGKGYTAFTLDIGGLLRYGASNTVAVKVDNAFDDSMLPRGQSSDWAHDGGIYRSVHLLVTPPVFIESVAIDADPDLAARLAPLAVTAVIRNTSSSLWTGAASYFIIDEATGNPALAAPAAASLRIAAGETLTVPLPPAVLRDPKLWHFDRPNLYTLRAELSSGHALEETFGVRKIEIRGASFYLNGEPIRPMGVERMAGSNPAYGMAEPPAWMEHDLADMQNLNCVYTRVHWPQDRAVLDWCDRHGMMIQTEVPTWGPGTFHGMTGEPAPAIMNNGLEQLREMIARDRNHPCVFSWGMCNEIGGQNPPAYAFARRMVEESKKLDPKRLVSYASNSLFTTPEKDVSGLMDYVMFNEYYGSWERGTVDDLARTLDHIHKAFPGKAVVISEYGYCACTPDRPEGDQARIRVLVDQDQVFRQRDYIAGLIFFCYNDYRTHVGDRGVGPLQQRVHGVVDVYGARKPSYEQLRAESSPIESMEASGSPAGLQVRIRTRSVVPAYHLRGYCLKAVAYGFGDIPVERIETALPDLAPGEQTALTLKFTEAHPVRITLDAMRPQGSSASSCIWKP
ncbi:MAG TPA: glycoside hydrolase family 2 TIM barrel-domain containing protein [Bryobacteraceae bacterium]|nr:glycoside hydrolase family 2 TIM barrel-domain containing protein [Bryobacteraceae bacterium]